jgi:hypothetical protein
VTYVEPFLWGASIGVLLHVSVQALMRLGELLDDTRVIRAIDRVIYSRPLKPVMWTWDLIAYRWRPPRRQS